MTTQSMRSGVFVEHACVLHLVNHQQHTALVHEPQQSISHHSQLSFHPSSTLFHCHPCLHTVFVCLVVMQSITLHKMPSWLCCGTLLLSIVVIAWCCWWCVCLKHHCDSINTTVIGQWMIGSGCHMASLNPTPIHFTTHTTLLTLWNHLPFPHFHFQKLLLPSLQSTLIHNINHLPFVVNPPLNHTTHG